MSADKPAATGSGEPTTAKIVVAGMPFETHRHCYFCGKSISQLAASFDYCESPANDTMPDISGRHLHAYLRFGKNSIVCVARIDSVDGKSAVPTPPASQPTVTREQLVKSLREMCNAAGWVLQGASMALGSLEDARIEALALLRAAEQK